MTKFMMKIFNARQMVGKFTKGVMLTACFSMMMSISGVANADDAVEVRNARGVLLGYLAVTDNFKISDSKALELADNITVSGKLDVTDIATFNGGIDAKENTIVNVADGVNASDVATVGQLAKKADKTDLDAETTVRKDADADLQKKIDAIGSSSSAGLNELNNKINQTNDRVDRVGATAAALAAINYQPMAKGQSQVAVGMGGYKGKKATALGLAYQISDRISGSVAGAANGSERMFNVGFNYLFGQHSDKDIAQCATAPGSVSLKEAELQAQVDSLKANNEAMQAHIAKQDAEMAELKAMVKALVAK